MNKSIPVLVVALLLNSVPWCQAETASTSSTQAAQPALTAISPSYHVTGQLLPEQLAGLKAQGITTIIDFRPDGEAPNQPTAAQMQQQAAALGLKFHYIPIGHQGISDQSAANLSQILSASQGPVVGYCRSGKRASRTYALALASQANGPSLEEILQQLKASGTPVDDLTPQLEALIADRK